MWSFMKKLKRSAEVSLLHIPTPSAQAPQATTSTPGFQPANTGDMCHLLLYIQSSTSEQNDFAMTESTETNGDGWNHNTWWLFF